jgi:phage FluMu gp28-like protein
VVAIKPRQCGITTLSSAWATAQCVFASKDAPETILCIANKLEQAQEIIIKIRDFLDQVPRWMWGPDYFSPDPNSEKNLKSIFEKDAKGELKLFNGCRVIARASGPNASRGISAVSVLILDEAAFIEDGVAAFTTAAATMASNPNSKTVMVSTPNGRDELYYNTYRQALSHENNFVAVQFRWYQDPRFNKFLVWKRKNEETG